MKITNHLLSNLAPDPATADRAKALASTKYWRELVGNPSIVWGACKSSGTTYYKAAFEIKSQSFKCNCKSRKYPCKHSLALGAIFSAQPDAFSVSDTLPDWVSDWLADGTPTGKNYTPEEEQAKAENRQKNFSKRLVTMEAGLNELENWLVDSLRQGLATLEQQPYSYWKEISARVHDAKLSGIGKRITAIPVLIKTDEKWPEKILEELTSYYLLIRGLRRMDELPLNMQQDLLKYSGVNIRKDDLFQYGQTVKDTWMVMAMLEGEEDNLRFRRTWIYGWKTAAFGLILDYAFGNKAFERHYKRGSVFEGSVVYYPSNAPLRLAVKEKKLLDRTIKRIVGVANFDLFLDFYAATLAANPWEISLPCSIENVQPVLDEKQLFFIDEQQKKIPVLNEEEIIWKILAISGGQSINVFGEWTGAFFIPMSISINEQYFSL